MATSDCKCSASLLVLLMCLQSYVITGGFYRLVVLITGAYSGWLAVSAHSWFGFGTSFYEGLGRLDLSPNGLLLSLLGLIRVRLGLVWLTPVWLGLVWLGLAWFG